MKRIIIFFTLFILLTACTRIEIGKDKIIIKGTENTTKSNSTLIKNIENKIAGKIPILESDLDTPEIVERRIIDETESVNFGDVV